ncbi:sigma-70 family RNA polymerase sigma factor [bacterium]|nr:sigma-70 family RNA polymerase sigma factor [bacterium]
MSKNGKKILEAYYKDNFSTLVIKQSRRAGSPENAEDVVQEAFAKALKHIDKYDPNKPFEGWFVTILNNSLRDFKRDERNYGMGLEFDEDLHELEPCYEGNELSNIVAHEIKQKQRPTRDILHLYFVREYKPSEICDVLSIPNKTIRMAVLRFKAMLIGKYGEA